MFCDIVINIIAKIYNWKYWANSHILHMLLSINFQCIHIPPPFQPMNCALFYVYVSVCSGYIFPQNFCRSFKQISVSGLLNLAMFCCCFFF